MDKIYGTIIDPNHQEHAQISMKVKDLVEMVNKAMNPDGPIFDWFAGYDDGKAAVEIYDGDVRIANQNLFIGGNIDGQHIDDLKVIGYNGKDGGVYCEGSLTNAVIDNAYISLEGKGKGLGGPDTGVSARKGATVTIKNTIINGYGRSRFCTTAETGSRLYVYDSILWSHGQPWGDGFETITEPMATPPAGLLIEGNSRTHCTMTNSRSYFYNSKIICDGWGALSTEGAEGFLYLEANDCDIIAVKRGYGTYADPDCHVYFNRCNFDVADMTILLAGKSDAHFRNCVCKNGSYFAVVHNVNGLPEEVGEMEVSDCSIHSCKDAVLCRSENVKIRFRRTDITADSGVLIRSEINDDPCRTSVSDHPFGIHVSFEEMQMEGDIIHTDPERDMYIEMNKVHFTGAVKGAVIKMDVNSYWFADADSDVTINGELSLKQIDAPAGVTVIAKGDQSGEYRLQSGGVLMVS